VEWIEMTNDSAVMREQLITSLRAGSSEYDIVSLDVVWAGEFAAAGFIESLDVFMRDAGLSVPQFNAGSMASGRYSARQYVLPFFPDLGFIYFRSDIVSEEDAARLIAGNYTHADLYEMAARYMGEGGTSVGIVFQSALYEGLTVNINEFTSNWTNVRGGLEMMRQFTDSDITPVDILNFTEGETHNSFINGQSVFARNWPYQWGMIPEGTITHDQVSVAPLPGGGSVGGWLLAINSNSENMSGAWEVLSFMATHEGQRIFSMTGGYLPGFNETLNDAEVIASNELLTKPGFQNALATTIARPVSAEYARVSDAIQRATHGFLSGGVDLDTAVSEIEAALAE
jgi:multiple sugar transport system substrate-binding protein